MAVQKQLFDKTTHSCPQCRGRHVTRNPATGTWGCRACFGLFREDDRGRLVSLLESMNQQRKPKQDA